MAAIKGGRIPAPGSMPSFDELQEILGFNSYYEEEKRYITNDNALSSQGGELIYRWIDLSSHRAIKEHA